MPVVDGPVRVFDDGDELVTVRVPRHVARAIHEAVVARFHYYVARVERRRSTLPPDREPLDARRVDVLREAAEAIEAVADVPERRRLR